MKQLVISLQNVSVFLHNVPVFKGVYLDVLSKELTSLIYENDIERDTFINLVTKKVMLDEGGILFYEHDNKDMGTDIWIVGYESNLSNSLTVGEHIFGFARGGKRRQKECDLLAQELFDRFQVDFQVHKKIIDLSNFEKIEVELFMAYTLEKKIVILSNLAAILSPVELETIWYIIESLKKSGHTFIVLDNYEDILHEKADNIYILRKGQVVQYLKKGEITRERINKILEVNKRDAPLSGQRNYNYAVEEIIVAFKGVYTEMFNNINVEIHRGEVCKVIDYDINRARHFLNLFLETSPILDGKIVLEKEQYVVKGYEEALCRRVGFIPVNPIEKTLFPDLTVKTNLFHPVSRKAPEALRCLRFEKSIKKALAEDISPEIYKKKVKELSSIEKINIVYAKWFLYFPKVLICVNPFNNYNIEMDKIIEKWILRVAKRGTSIIIFSSNWPSHLMLQGKEYFLCDWQI